MTTSADIQLISEYTLRDKIYVIRRQKVMLNRDLAEIYGYETRYFNRQVNNNKEKFIGEDFRFQLARVEYDNLMCNFFTSSLNESIEISEKNDWGGVRKLPYAFTEQGIYMLVTVLKGELATIQSRNLVRLFKQMKDVIVLDKYFVSRNSPSNFEGELRETNFFHYALVRPRNSHSDCRKVTTDKSFLPLIKGSNTHEYHWCINKNQK